MRISYSKYRMYIECPQKYHWATTNKPYSVKLSKYFAIYGIVIQKFFEYYVNTYIKTGTLTDDQIKSNLKLHWDSTLKKEYVVWNDPWCKQTSDELFNNIYTDILLNLKAFDFFKYMKSEVVFNIKLTKSQDELTGRLDFIINRPDGTLEILDGKGTNKQEDVDYEQLYFYALMYYLKYKRIPDKLGFWFYKFQTVKYIDFTMDDLVKFKDKFALIKKTIKEAKEFLPPSKIKMSKVCEWCEFKYDCTNFLTKKEANRIKRGRGVPITNTGEIQEFGL